MPEDIKILSKNERIITIEEIINHAEKQISKKRSNVFRKKTYLFLFPLRIMLSIFQYK